MSNFLILLSDNSLFMGWLKLTLLLSLLWLIYLRMSNVNPVWRSRFWRIGAILTFSVLLLSFSPPQLEFAIARPMDIAIESGEIRSTGLVEPATNRLMSSENVLPRSSETIAVQNEQIATAPTTANEPFNIESILIGIWITGVSVLLLRWIVTWTTAWRICGCRDAMEGTDDALVARLARKFGIKNAPRVFHATVGSPCLVYFPKPFILMPRGFDIPSKALPAVYGHELAHLKRRDWHWNVVFSLLETLLWFHPFVWKIRSTHLSDCENACDDLAAELIGGRSVYQRILARVALICAPSAPVVGLSMVRKPEIIRRLGRLDLPIQEFSLRRLIVTVATTAALASAFSTFSIALVDSDTDETQDTPKPNGYSLRIPLTAEELKQTKVEIRWHEKGGDESVIRQTTPDTEGWVRGEMGTQPLSSASIIIRVPRYVPFAITRHTRNRQIVLPQEETVTLTKAYRLSGIVVNTDGKRVSDARVELNMMAQDSWDLRRVFDLANVKTNDQGEWAIGNAPWNLKAAEVNIKVKHPHYLATWGSVPEHAANDVLSIATLNRGVGIKGSVFDIHGQLLEGVRVTLGSQKSGIKPAPPEDFTDSTGRFELQNCRTGAQFIVASKNGFAPELIEVDVRENESPDDRMTLKLKPGKTIKARLVDQFDKPVKDATVAIQSWRKDHSLGFNTKTDSEGRFEWHDAPEDGAWFTFAGKKHRLIVHHELKPSLEEQTVLIYTSQQVRLKLVGDQTDAIIQEADVMRGLKLSADRDEVSWDDRWTPFVDGKLEITFRRTVPETWLKIRSPGYRATIEKFKLGDENKDLTLRLQPLDANKLHEEEK